MSNEMVIVRTYSAGVHIGRLVSQDHTVVVLNDARRLWRWSGANTLNEVAIRGVDNDYTRISEPVSRVILTEAIEIISVSDAAVDNLCTSRWGPL